jgi:hypothetical protein
MTGHASPSHAPTERQLQVLLNEAGAEVDVELYERRIADGLEAVDLTGLDDKNVSGAALECLAVNRPDSFAFADKLDFIVRVTMRTRSRTWLSVKEKH